MYYFIILNLLSPSVYSLFFATGFVVAVDVVVFGHSGLPRNTLMRLWMLLNAYLCVCLCIFFYVDNGVNNLLNKINFYCLHQVLREQATTQRE